MNILESLISYIKGPVGEAKTIESVEKCVQDAIAVWDKIIPAKSSIFSRASANLDQVTNYLLGCVDIFINAVEGNVTEGQDKKATVLLAIGEVYDHITTGVIPTWMLPFSSIIRAFILQTIISAAIDFIVKKYNEGEWKTN